MPPYKAKNGFGVEFEIEKQVETVVAIGGLRKLNPYWKAYWTTNAAGDEARILSQNIRIRMSGMLRNWEAGQPVRCGVKTTFPTARIRKDITLNICLFNGEADLFEIIDAASGEILHVVNKPR